MKKFLHYIIFILFILIPFHVKANSISNIDMEIYIDSFGTAHVKEIWSAHLTEGTEGYKPYYNIGDAQIENFKVTENNRQYTVKENWDTSASFESKAYQNGIHYVKDGLELCFGISEYGYHEYELTYDIRGFVVSLEDADMIYWNLISHHLSSKPGNVHIKIYTDNHLSDTIPVWGYGNRGTAYVYDGYIEMNSEGTLDEKEYMTILVRFDKGTFQTNHILNHDFAYYQKLADKGTDNQNKITPLHIFIYVIGFIIQAIQFGVVAFIIFKLIRFSNGKSLQLVGGNRFDYGSSGSHVPKDVPNVREIPFDKNIYRTFFIAESYHLNSRQTDLLGAILLVWLMENKITIIKKETGLLKKEESAIDLTKNVYFNNELEAELYDMLREASKDNILEAKEFEKWCQRNYSKILHWFYSVIDKEKENLIASGKIEVKEKDRFKLFKSKVYVIDPSMKEDAIQLKGFKNFLEEFSRIGDKQAIEVHQWEYYLIYAQILGIADKVAKQFKKLYPEIIENNQYGYTYSDIMFIHAVSYSSMNRATNARAASYSSGGGGFSSSGGGGGAFGGGSGSSGGGFR